MKSFFWNSGLFVLLLCCFRAQGIYEFQTIEIDDSVLIQQSPMACVPTSFLYMMKFGNKDLKAAYEAIPGKNDLDKLNDIIEFGGNSQGNKVGVFFDPDSATSRAVFEKWMDTFLTDKGLSKDIYTTFMANREESETRPGAFISRVHHKILKSLANQIPVMTGVELTTIDHSSKEMTKELSHAIVILGVQKALSDSEAGFSIWYFDPVHGEIFSGYIHEELHQPFNADIFESPENINGRWSDGELGVIARGGTFISSPYLKIRAPSIGDDVSLGWDQTRSPYIDVLMLGQ